MKIRNIFAGIVFILIAVLFLLHSAGLLYGLFESIGGVDLWEIALGVVVIAFIVSDICRIRFRGAVFMSALLFLIFEDNVSYLLGYGGNSIVDNWLVIIGAGFLSLGVHFLIDKPFENKRKKKKTARNAIFSDTVVYIDSSTMRPDCVKNKLGDCTVYFENCETYTGGKTIEVSNKLGDMNIYVPSGWRVVTEISSKMGDLYIQPPPYEDADGMPVLTIVGGNVMGDIRIEYV